MSRDEIYARLESDNISDDEVMQLMANLGEIIVNESLV